MSLTASQCIAATIRAMNELGVPHMLTGSLASNIYGLPRMSKDADFVVELAARSIEELARHVAPDLTLDPQPAFETATLTHREAVAERRRSPAYRMRSWRSRRAPAAGLG